MITLVVYAAPVAKGRPRFRKATGYAYTPAKTALGEWQIRQAFIERFGESFDRLLGPLRMTVQAWVAMPQSIPKRDRLIARPHKRPDLDQYIKSALDALNGHAFADDAQVVELIASKRYGEPPRWEITVEPISAIHVPAQEALIDQARTETAVRTTSSSSPKEMGG